MTSTNNLRKLIVTMLKEVCNTVYCEVAENDEIYPRIVYSVSRIDLGDLVRKDYVLDIDIWDKSESSYKVEEIKDKVEDLFNGANKPCERILPTFYLIGSNRVPDEDKLIKHRVVKVQIQNYER